MPHPTPRLTCREGLEGLSRPFDSELYSRVANAIDLLAARCLARAETTPIFNRLLPRPPAQVEYRDHRDSGAQGRHYYSGV